MAFRPVFFWVERNERNSVLNVFQERVRVFDDL